jgi:cytochrome c553
LGGDRFALAMRRTACGLFAVLACSTHHSLAATLEERLRPCLLCHGQNGQSATPETPSLGAQTAPYLLIQIFL